MAAATEIVSEEAAPRRIERPFRAALCVLGSVVLLVLIAHLALLLWAQHELTPVESIVALHSNMLATGEGLYYDLNRYPFTVSPYGPIFYSLSALLHNAGLSLFHGGRLISFTALLWTLWFVWRSLGLLVSNQFARWSGLLLVASTATLLFWGTVGQTDMLAVSLSLAAFVKYLDWRQRASSWSLFASGGLVILAVFTKQTALAAGAAIAVHLIMRDRKRAAIWIAGVGICGLSAALLLNAITHGRYFQDAIWAMLNPWPLSALKLEQQISYLLLTSGGMLLVTAAGLRYFPGKCLPLYLYTGLAAVMLLLTASKIGSDLNYQIELIVLLGICAACTLDQLRMFPKLLAGDRSWVTLLQLPLLLHVILNLALSVRTIAEGVVLEPERRVEYAELAPYLTADRGRVLTSHFDALVHSRGRMEVEPLIYVLLVQAGMTDPEPVRKDLAARRFQTVIIGEDVFAATTPVWRNEETLSLPAAQMDAIRKNYKLVRHVKGPYLAGSYVYEPLRD